MCCYDAKASGSTINESIGSTRPWGWAYEHAVTLLFIRPGKPIENCIVESFNGRLRDECLNLHWLTNLTNSRRKIEHWRLDYNHVLPQSSLGNLPPAEFAGAMTQEEMRVC